MFYNEWILVFNNFLEVYLTRLNCSALQLLQFLDFSSFFGPNSLQRGTVTFALVRIDIPVDRLRIFVDVPNELLII